MKLNVVLSTLTGAVALVVAPGLHAQILTTTENPNAADAQVDDANGTYPTNFTPEVTQSGNYVVRVGEQNAPGGADYVMPFLLPTVAAGTQFTAASLQTQLLNVTGTPTFNGDLYALTRISTSPLPLASDYYQGTADSSNTLLQAAYYTPTSPARTNPTTGPFVTTSTTGNTALVNFLNAVDPAGSANAGSYIFLRINPDATVIPNGNNAYGPLTDNAGGTQEKPILTLTTGPLVPEPSPIALTALSLIGLVGLGIYRRRAA